MTTLIQDLRYGIRMLMRNPGFYGFTDFEEKRWTF
jgi:hypothetical protein